MAESVLDNNQIILNKKSVFGGLVLIMAAVALLVGVPQVQALTLTPPMLEFGAEQGGVVSAKVKVINESSEPVQLYTSTANFTAKDETGNPYFLFNESGGLASWIKVQAGPITLLPNERQDIPFIIEVPKGAESGGYYAGIFFGPPPPGTSTGQSNVGISSKLGSLIILRVGSNVKTKNEIKEFHILNDQTFFTSLPVHFWYRLHNSGNVHVRPCRHSKAY